MKCPKCGKDSSGKYCQECGTEIKIETSKKVQEVSCAKSEEKKDSSPNTILILGIVGLFTCWFLLGIIPAIIAIAWGISYLRSKKENSCALIGMIFGGAAIVFATILIVFGSSEIIKTVKVSNLIENQQYSEALQYMNEKNCESREEMYECYVGLQEYDEAADVILNFVYDKENEDNLLNRNDYALERLDKIYNEVSLEKRKTIDEYNLAVDTLRTKKAEEKEKAEADSKAKAEAEEKAKQEAEKEAEEKARQESIERQKKEEEKQAKIEASRINLNDQLEFSVDDDVCFEAVVYCGYGKKDINVYVPCVTVNSTDDVIIKNRTIHITGDNKKDKEFIKELNVEDKKGTSIFVEGKVKSVESEYALATIETTSVSLSSEKMELKDLYRQYAKTYNYDYIRRNLEEGAAFSHMVRIASIKDGYLYAYDIKGNQFFIENTSIDNVDLFDGDSICFYGRYDGLSKSTAGTMVPEVYAFTFDFINKEYFDSLFLSY